MIFLSWLNSTDLRAQHYRYTVLLNDDRFKISLHKCQQSFFQQPPVESGAAGIGECTFSCEMGAAILHMSVGMWFHRCAHLVATCALSFFIYPSHTYIGNMFVCLGRNTLVRFRVRGRCVVGIRV